MSIAVEQISKSFGSFQALQTVDLTVKETAPGLKSATVNSSLKPATTETGLVVPVPNFIDVGDVIRVDTATGEYLSRAK